MAVYQAPLRDMRFLFHEYLNIGQHSNLPGFADATPDVIDAVLTEAEKLGAEVLLPLNETGDREGCSYDPKTKTVTTPKGFKDAYKLFAQGGWVGLSALPEFGGQGLPASLATATSEIFTACNWAFAMYPGLAHGAYSAIVQHGSETQRKSYLPKLVSGEWSGTMNLTEPQCGTDLSLIRTRAEPQADGSYKITGTKIWISGGEHDLSENTIHLVLARIDDAPEGIRGISLFLVPKVLVKDDGALGARNKVFCGGLEKKMGIHGNATCVMNYEGATGFLVGEAHKGMRAMFTMMNEARIAVGMQGLAISEIAYQNAVDFARKRIQGRSLTGPKNPEALADPIIVHPDVRRMLMDIRCFNEGARGLLLWTALQGDLEAKAQDSEARERSADFMALLTPVIKAYLSEKGFLNAVTAQQVLGGAGFVKDYPLEQFVRDSRIALIYEGTNGIQALDLVGRKLPQNGGRAIMAFFKHIDQFLADTKTNDALKPWREGLASARAALDEATQWLIAIGLSNPDNAGAVAMDYLHLTALTALASVWAGMVMTAQAKLKDGGADKAFYENKIKTGRYFLDRVLPDAALHLQRLKAGSEAMLALPAEAF